MLSLDRTPSLALLWRALPTRLQHFPAWPDACTRSSSIVKITLHGTLLKAKSSLHKEILSFMAVIDDVLTMKGTKRGNVRK